MPARGWCLGNDRFRTTDRQADRVALGHRPRGLLRHSPTLGPEIACTTASGPLDLWTSVLNRSVEGPGWGGPQPIESGPGPESCRKSTTLALGGARVADGWHRHRSADDRPSPSQMAVLATDPGELRVCAAVGTSSSFTRPHPNQRGRADSCCLATDQGWAPARSRASIASATNCRRASLQGGARQPKRR